MISLESIDYDSPTDLCHMMKKNGSDKGLGLHNYTLVYDKLFGPIRQNPINLFELGLGSNNPEVPFNMGPDGVPGASLRGWKEYFPNAQIYGGDVDDRILFEEERIKTYHTDQTSKEHIDAMWEKIPENFDIIIDDAIHKHYANMTFFQNSFHKVKEGGMYIIEDIQIRDIHMYYKDFRTMGLNFKIYTIPNHCNCSDNNLAVIFK